MQLISDFFVELDAQWPRQAAKVRLSIIGCSALMLQGDYERGTNALTRS
jgi:hypothetical protein